MSQKHASDMASTSEQLRMLRESYEVQMREYEALMDLKIQLDHEIATYRALLQEEENRQVSHSMHWMADPGGR